MRRALLLLIALWTSPVGAKPFFAARATPAVHATPVHEQHLAPIVLSSVRGFYATPTPVPQVRKGRPRAPRFDDARRALLQPAHETMDLHSIIKPPPTSYALDNSIHTILRERPGMGIPSTRPRAIARLLDLDANHKLLSAEEWETVRLNYARSAEHAHENAAERLSFHAQDVYANDHTVAMIEQRALGRLAKKLASALEHEKPAPERLAEIAETLSTEHPYLANPWKVEMLIADMRRVFPTLGAWDFRTHTDGKAYRAPHVLPPSTQSAISQIGYAALADSAVVMTSHMYRDAIVMADALTALGADPKAMRFVATPYPFDDRVKVALRGRGIVTESAPYDKEKTRAHVVDAIRAALDSEKNGPILVLDDGGLATEVIAKEFPLQLHRFRIVEVTKAGERIGKTLLPDLARDVEMQTGRLDAKDLEAFHQRYLEAHSWDPTSKTVAEQTWQKRQARGSTMHPEGRYERALSSSFGFAYYTYSNTAYKRDVMTPLYTEQVNRSLFDAIEREGKKPANQRVTVIGGGAMGLAAAKELRASGHEVTFVEPESTRVSLLQQEGFTVEPLRSALKGRSIILEMSGMKNVLGLNEVFAIDDGAFVVHGSSKDNPFDMKSISAMATEKIAWPEHNGQRSATYKFSAAGRTKELHFLGDGFTISHGGKTQNVPLDQFVPELDALLNIGVHAVQAKAEVTRYPFYTATDAMMRPAAP
ncbi:MAG: hypothetical protein ABI321_07770 [Polyangia bacterium]